MINILFVDDEPNILNGLRRMLRSMRHEWNMAFANSGEEALAMLQASNIDVIVSDMKMPGMDGSQLFEAVRARFPRIVRIILSGYSEKEIIMKSVGSSHQYLSKPCDPDSLKATVTRVCSLRNLLTDEHLRELVSQLPTVPSLPVFYSDLIGELGKSDPSTRKVADIVKQDIGMTVKILQLVNSAFFGLRRHISDSKEAVDFLGIDTISSLTLGLGVISQFESQTSRAFFAEIWEHSMAVGIMAQKIAVSEDRTVSDDAFTAGLLHDLGKIVLAVNLPHQYDSVREIMQRDNLTRLEAERHVFGATHAEVGAYLLGLWGLPSQVVQAVAFHNSPHDANNDSFSATTAVHVANAIRHFSASDHAATDRPTYDLEYLDRLGLTERTPVWEEKCSWIGASV